MIIEIILGLSDRTALITGNKLHGYVSLDWIYKTIIFRLATLSCVPDNVKHTPFRFDKRVILLINQSIRARAKEPAEDFSYGYVCEYNSKKLYFFLFPYYNTYNKTRG